MVPNDPSNFPLRHIVITMPDECTASGRVDQLHHVPIWLHPNQPHPQQFLHDMQIDSVIGKLQYQGVLFDPADSMQYKTYDPLLHTLERAQIQIERGEYYLASPFQVYSFFQKNGSHLTTTYMCQCQMAWCIMHL